jgi:hypothetical protein
VFRCGDHVSKAVAVAPPDVFCATSHTVQPSTNGRTILDGQIVEGPFNRIELAFEGGEVPVITASEIHGLGRTGFDKRQQQVGRADPVTGRLFVVRYRCARVANADRSTAEKIRLNGVDDLTTVLLNQRDQPGGLKSSGSYDPPGHVSIEATWVASWWQACHRKRPVRLRKPTARRQAQSDFVRDCDGSLVGRFDLGPSCRRFQRSSKRCKWLTSRKLAGSTGLEPAASGVTASVPKNLSHCVVSTCTDEVKRRWQCRRRVRALSRRRRRSNRAPFVPAPVADEDPLKAVPVANLIQTLSRGKQLATTRGNPPDSDSAIVNER